MDELKKLRNDLDMCDEILIDALRMRCQIIQEITNYKQKNGLPIYQAEEEERKKSKMLAKLDDYEYKKSIMAVYDSVLYRSKRIQSHELFGFNIFLIGFMGVGKSTVSNSLQNTFAMDVVEMDEMIAKKNNMSISEIFDLHGEEYFRNEETNLLKEVGNEKNKIVSCGGGVAMREVNVQEMRKSGKVILLTAKPETILERVKENHDRPLLENNKTVEYVSELMEKRRPAYEAAADIVIATDGKSANEICEEIIAQVKSRAQSSLVSAGHSTAVLRAASYTSPMAAFQDKMAGIAYYQFIEKLDKEFEERKDDLVKELSHLMQEILRPEYLCVSYTGERDSLMDVQKQVKALKQTLHKEEVSVQHQNMTCVKENEGFTTSGQVQYVAQTGNFRKKGYEYTGALNILKVALSYDYLWTNIRVKGGAYGCMSGFKRSGESFFVSYRDPHLRRTLDVFKGIPEYVRSFKADEREMTKYIIGTISGKDVPRTPKMQGAISRSAWFCGITEEMAQKERDEILKASETDIQELAPLIEAILDNDAVCVVGSEPAIEKEKELFDTVLPLISC